MEFLRSKTMFCILLSMHLAACLAQAQPDHGFSYDEDSPIGPAHWGQIKPEWHMCSDGKMQSPIDIWDHKAEVDSQLGELQRQYRSSVATLGNRGYDIMLRWIRGGGHIYIDGTLFHLIQCHWHAPSEHHRNGRSYALEIHLVHQADDYRTAVIGMVYEIGPPDPFLSMLEPYIENIANHTNYEEIIVGNIDPEWINIGYGEYFRYMGSLTTPPCSENIIWTVMRKVNTVSRRQVDLIRRAIHDESKTNARPVQQLNHRLIKLYKPKPWNAMDHIFEYVLGSLDKNI